MSVNNNPYELYKLLPKTNCGRCLLPSCIAFAAAVIRGAREPGACPELSPKILLRLRNELEPRRDLSDEQEDAVVALRQEVAKLDLAVLAPRVGAHWSGARLVVSCLGKDFFIDRDGRVSSACHINPWLQMPLLRYLLVCRGVAEKGEWLPMARLAAGLIVAPLFAKRCEEPLRRLADEYGLAFFSLLTMFGAKQSKSPPQNGEDDDNEQIYIFRPLPLVPFRLVYQFSEEGLASTLRVFFDRSAEENATPEMLHFLGAGISAMMEKILKRSLNC